eukprot:TRINITY_DN4524_c0_g1_i5.p1 TRINITY_DN4524_c0_g1~~TRINITY_DN4524_c0_g1_i5.p1  ORF type:complete len:1535 (+),score=420.35 TRINITY_DN4524_c0_g1_i5:150-4607(+)
MLRSLVGSEMCIRDRSTMTAYLVPTAWYTAWQQYAAAASDADPLAALIDDGTISTMDLTPLLPEDRVAAEEVWVHIEAGYETRRLRDGIEPGKDFDIVTPEVWEGLKPWHPREDCMAVPRSMRELDGESSCELNPLLIWVSRVDKIPGSDDVQSVDEATFAVPRDMPAESVHQLIATYFDVGVGTSRSQLITASENTVALCGETNIPDLVEDEEIQQLVFEAQDRHGRWPAEVSKFVIGNTDGSVLSQAALSKHNEKWQKRHEPSGKADAPGLCGLHNLGNTCYMNSSLQCLSHTHELTTHFLSGQHTADINETNPLGSGGKLATAYSDFVNQLWTGGFGVISPSALKTQIGGINKQFEGCSQHDAEELLSCLLNGLHEDLCTHWELGIGQSTVTELFRSVLSSQVRCGECDSCFDKKDPSMILSLALPNTFAQTYEVTVVPWEGLAGPLVMGLRTAPWSSAGDLLDMLLAALSQDHDQIPDRELWKVCVVSDRKISKILSLSDGLDIVSKASSLLALCPCVSSGSLGADIVKLEPHLPSQSSVRREPEPEPEAEAEAETEAEAEAELEVELEPSRPGAGQSEGLPEDPGEVEEPRQGQTKTLWERMTKNMAEQAKKGGEMKGEEMASSDEMKKSVLQLVEILQIPIENAQAALKESNGSVESAMAMILDGWVPPKTAPDPAPPSPVSTASSLPDVIALPYPEPETVTFSAPPSVIALPGPEPTTQPSIDPDPANESSDADRVMEFTGCSQQTARKALKKHRNNIEAAGMAVLCGEISDGEEEAASGGGYNTDDSSKAQHGDNDDSLAEQMKGCLDMFGFDDDDAGKHGSTEMVSSTEMVPSTEMECGDQTGIVDVGAPAEGGSYQPIKPDFWKSVRNGEPKAVRDAIDAGQFETESNDKIGAIHVLLRGINTRARSQARHIECLTQLLEAKADPHSTTSNGCTVLHQAVSCSSDDMLTKLHECTGMLDAQDHAGETPLHLACRGNYVKAVAQLLTLGADVQIVNVKGETCLDMARNNGYDAVLDHLLCRPIAVRLVHSLAPQASDEAPEPAGAGEQPALEEAALLLKAEGNGCYNDGRYDEAIRLYTAALSQLGDVEGSAIASSCLNNRAQCYAQQKEFEQVVHDTTQALKHEPGSVKALMRRANGFFQIEKLKDAYRDYKNVAGMKDPGLQGNARTAFNNFKSDAFRTMKDIGKALVADGVDLDSIVLGDTPVVAVVSRSSAANSLKAILQPGLVMVPRGRHLTGMELYAAVRRASSWQQPHQTQQQPDQTVGQSLFDLKYGAQNAVLVEEDESEHDVTSKGASLVAEWKLEAAPSTPEPHVHESVHQGRELDKRELTLQECVDEFVAPETLGEDDSFFCPTCQASRVVTKTMAFDSLPKIMIIHLKRFYHTLTRRGKINNMIQFPLQGLQFPGHDGTYSLFGVINHFGTLAGGHYTCLLYTSDAADEEDSVDLGGRRIIKKKNSTGNTIEKLNICRGEERWT